MRPARQVLDDLDFLSAIGVWPAIPGATNVERWLANFEPAEEETAVALLSTFVYLNSRMVDELFVAAWRAFSTLISREAGARWGQSAHWQDFFAQVVVTYPTGETPSVADSGYAFVRRSRDLLRIPESNLFAPSEALAAAIEDGRPIVFVDDIAASGDQFLETWRRPYGIHDPTSFREAAQAHRIGSIHYLPLLATWHAQHRIRKYAPQVSVRPTHQLGSEYSAKSYQNLYWDGASRAKHLGHIRRASLRAGYSPDGIFGHEQLALALAFEHQIPDATLPIFHSDRNGWYPLFRRSS